MKKLLFIFCTFCAIYANEPLFLRRSLLGEIFQGRDCQRLVKSLRYLFSLPENDEIITQMIADEMNISTLADQRKFKAKYKDILALFDSVSEKSCEKYKFLKADLDHIDQIMTRKRNDLELQQH